MKVSEFNVEDYYYDRQFRLLFYQLSHGEMIIRSSKKDTKTGIVYDHNIDVYFGDIKYIEVPKKLEGIAFRKSNEEDAKYLVKRTGSEIAKDEIIVIVSKGKEYYVVASVISVLENDLSYTELPISCFFKEANQ